jgi:hypothetical protein
VRLVDFSCKILRDAEDVVEVRDQSIVFESVPSGSLYGVQISEADNGKLCSTNS